MNITPEKKQYLLNDSKSFCMMPWIHMHITPGGVALPCCIGDQKYNVGNASEHTIAELINNDHMNALRLDMLENTLNPVCSTCHRHEAQGVDSSRKSMNEIFKAHFDESLLYTDITGQITKFKMRYFDIRLSNICNMKCRTCNSHYSSLWEQEDARQGRKIFTIEKNTKASYLHDIIHHVPYIEMAYFAGGEPFITEEHYTILEEMIRQKRSHDITLSYNTNLSTLKFKDKDLLSLWKHFKKGINIYASLDHYGDRAEYIRHGTDWGQIETNFELLKNNPDVTLAINSVLNIFNFQTFGDFYLYLLEKRWINEHFTSTVYNMVSPKHLTALALPMNHKLRGISNINAVLPRMHYLKFFAQAVQLENAIKWVTNENAGYSWEEYSVLFRDEVKRLDELRGENFEKVFPELADLLHG